MSLIQSHYDYREAKGRALFIGDTAKPIEDHYYDVTILWVDEIRVGRRELEIVFKVKQLRFESCKLERPMFISVFAQHKYLAQANVSLAAPSNVAVPIDNRPSAASQLAPK